MDLLTDISGGVAHITFNRPAARNAVTGAMLSEMRRFLVDVENSPAVRCILVTGTGEHFMAGGDVRGFGEKLGLSSDDRRIEFEGRVQTGSTLFAQWARMPQPTVCRVRGAAAGAALGIIGASDFVLCGTSSVFVLAHVGIGATPDGGTTWWLPRIVGVRRAKEIALLGQRFGAAEALQMGLVTRVVPDDQLDTLVDEWVDRITAAPAESVRRTKHLLDSAPEHSLAQQLDLEAQCFAACAATDDFIEGVSAFLEKRRARFRGATD